MFAHNGYWLHPANCQLFSVHVTTFSGVISRKFWARKLKANYDEIRVLLWGTHVDDDDSAGYMGYTCRRLITVFLPLRSVSSDKSFKRVTYIRYFPSFLFRK
ncbi:hypothetical protein PGIN_11A_01924 [Porphyromonas gingivalis]|nr:hypothetical protein PGIN_11A_01924 [Porphyromonas gingivalis]